jgi:hypothetical protein
MSHRLPRPFVSGSALFAVLSLSFTVTGRGRAASPPAPTHASPAAAPATSNANTFIPTAAMSVRRSGATATLLPDGDVLVGGGDPIDSAGPTVAADLYIPVLLSVSPGQAPPGSQPHVDRQRLVRP